MILLHTAFQLNSNQCLNYYSNHIQLASISTITPIAFSKDHHTPITEPKVFFDLYPISLYHMTSTKPLSSS